MDSDYHVLSVLDTVHNFTNKRVACHKSHQKSPQKYVICCLFHLSISPNFVYTLYVLKLDVDCSMGAGHWKYFWHFFFEFNISLTSCDWSTRIVKGLFKSVLKAFKRRPKIEANQRTTTTTSSSILRMFEIISIISAFSNVTIWTSCSQIS